MFGCEAAGGRAGERQAATLHYRGADLKEDVCVCVATQDAAFCAGQLVEPPVLLHLGNVGGLVGWHGGPAGGHAPGGSEYVVGGRELSNGFFP